jgi:toxin YoeB
MEVVYAARAQEDIAYFKDLKDAKLMAKISQLVEAIKMSPFKGLGKPEPLKYRLSGCWSRRINQEHRIVYEVHSDRIDILSLRGHY